MPTATLATTMQSTAVDKGGGPDGGQRRCPPVYMYTWIQNQRLYSSFRFQLQY